MSIRSALLILASGFLAIPSFASDPCETAISGDFTEFGKFTAYECSAQGAPGPVCVLDYQDGSLRFSFPAAPTFYEDGVIRNVKHEGEAAIFAHSTCYKWRTALVPFYDSDECLRSTATVYKVSYHRSNQSISIDFNWIDSHKKKNNRSEKMSGECKLYQAHEDRMISKLMNTVMKNSSGHAFLFKALDTSADRITLAEVPAQTERQITYPEVTSFKRLSWREMSSAHLASGVLDSSHLSGKTYQCYTSSTDGSRVHSSNGLARIRFQSVPRKKTELGLTSSLQVKVLTPFVNRTTLPDGASSAVIYDGDQASFLLVPRAGGVDYMRVTALDGAAGMSAFSVKLDTFVMKDAICFRE